MALVLFDIDGTLVQGPSTERRFLGYLLQRRAIGIPQLAGAVGGLVVSTLRHGCHGTKKNKGYLLRLSADGVRKLASAWAKSSLGAALYTPALARLRRHQRLGDRIILLSGTLDFIAESVSHTVGVDQYIGTKLPVRKGRFCALGPSLHPFGTEKLRLAKRLAETYGVRSDEVVAYGDSIHDAHLLGWVGSPNVVRPDRRLLRIARVRGWPVLSPDCHGPGGLLTHESG